jgi:hypothetical protein
MKDFRAVKRTRETVRLRDELLKSDEDYWQEEEGFI